ncbi:cellobiose-specific phosphotransferase system component IIB [Flavobacterium arsenatis]|uniref:Cellobiose-specific phosphotransferase system component IIB n=1 Tax=Flavobacterium arsenatis TaxID=1484332 RepID=A0ABU1TKQ9_9FLAO|nr:hypothetical protein [Flavobacterium arsenatis]MDR6966531.1 cellobiose-specific phosphotransferase system component IIB [Flavobacterium arsenatis]
MNNTRKDLSNWIIHFVHRRNPKNDPLEFSYDWENDFEYIPYPDSFTFDGEPLFLTEKYEEDDYGLEPDAHSFSVLKKILHDGIIKTGWSFRKGSPTIYGPKSAACFTEMPFYALIEYSKNRNDFDSIEPYGLAFIKEELFEAGARPVIYGLSGKHIESKEGDSNYGIGLRTLSSDCGIGINEMYRYVYTSIKRQKKIDWTHEREWRWADLDGKFDFPGMPFIAKTDEISFSTVIVFVKTNEEVQDILDHILNLHHSQTTNFDRLYDLKLLENILIVSMEALSTLSIDIEEVKFDDLPVNKIPKMKNIAVSKETYKLVKEAILEAERISFSVSEEKYKQYGDIGACGFANIVTYESNSEITQALINLEIAHSFAKGEYIIYLKGYPVQSIDVKEYGAIEAAKYLTEKLNQSFYSHTRLD